MWWWVWTILLWIGWLTTVGVGLAISMFVLAFADSPGANKAVQRAILPAMLYALAAIGVGGWLMIWRGGWWQAPVAFVLAVSVPIFLLTAATRLMRRKVQHIAEQLSVAAGEQTHSKRVQSRVVDTSRRDRDDTDTIR
jgi:hypothetical protein